MLRLNNLDDSYVVPTGAVARATPGDDWDTPSGVRRYTDANGSVRCVEVGVRGSLGSVHSVKDPDVEDEANAVLIQLIPRMLQSLKDLAACVNTNTDPLAVRYMGIQEAALQVLLDAGIDIRPHATADAAPEVRDVVDLDGTVYGIEVHSTPRYNHPDIRDAATGRSLEDWMRTRHGHHVKLHVEDYGPHE